MASGVATDDASGVDVVVGSDSAEGATVVASSVVVEEDSWWVGG